ncbi:MAG: phosphatidylserine decarboxylase [Epsilonproteobacteria bacterium]|nr:phosphatidylserine decarboxylase [Campylobacterota bacterium]
MNTNSVSWLFGKIARTHFPPSIQCFINKLYVKIFEIDMSLFEEENPCNFATLNELFIRKKKDIEFHDDEDVVCSPCDGLIMEHGEIQEGKAYQIKSKSYSIDELIPNSNLQDGFFINIYLSPKDYHRYHTPIDMQVLSATHIPGALYPVNLPSLQKRDNLFVKNERVVLKCKDKKDRIFYFVAVGALNVGKIVFNFDLNINTNINTSKMTTFEYKDLFLKKGSELGRFEMGSTILLFFGDEHFKYLNRKDEIEVGDILGEIY